MRSSPLRPALAAVLLGSALAAQAVRVVDATGATGVTTIQAAIAAASDGDVILIKSGTYTSGNFDVNDKALTFIADAGAAVTAVSARITNPNGKTVAIRGILFRRNSAAVAGLNPGRNLHVIDNTGTVWIEGCTFETGGTIVATPGSQYPAVESVTPGTAGGGTLLIVRCTIRGARGVRTPQGMMQAGVGISSNGNGAQRLVLHDCVVEGGDGAPGFFPTAIPGGNGATALESPQSSVFAAGGSIAGGDGGSGGSGGGCTNAGIGGDGLVVAGTGSAHLLGTACTGGAAGAASGACSAGVGGAPFTIAPAGSLRIEPVGVPHSLTMTAPVRDGTSTTASFTGEPGAAAFSFVSFAPAHTGVAGLVGPALLDLGTVVSFGFVTLGPGGTATQLHPFPDVLPPAMQVGVVFLQSLQIGTNTLVPGAPSLLVVLQ